MTYCSVFVVQPVETRRLVPQFCAPLVVCAEKANLGEGGGRE